MFRVSFGLPSLSRREQKQNKVLLFWNNKEESKMDAKHITLPLRQNMPCEKLHYKELHFGFFAVQFKV